MPVASFWAVVEVIADSAVLTFLSNVVVSLTANYLLGKLGDALTGNDGSNPAPTGQEFTVRDSIAARTMVYGQTRTSGALLYEYTSGSQNQYLWIVIGLAGHQVEAITDVWLDNELITSAQIDAGTGAVTGGKFAGKVSIFRHLGTEAQTVDAALTAARGEWDANHKLQGIAYMVLKLEHDTTLFPAGGPQNYFAMVKGKRVYDPRLDTTNGGSGSHRLTDATTWAWSENPALIYADYMTSGSIAFDAATPKRLLGMGQASARIDWPYIAAAANICDQTPVIPGSTTQKRYTCNGVLSCADTHASNLALINSTAVAQHTRVGGKFRLFAGAYDAPALSFNDQDLVGAGYEMLTLGRKDLYNYVTSIYFDPDRNYQRVNSTPVTSSTYVTADNGETIPRTVDLAMVTNEYRAQRITYLHLLQSRNLTRIKLYLGLNGFKLGLWETFSLTLTEPAWAGKVFRCVEWSLNPDQPGVIITAREEASGAYTDLAAGSYGALGGVTGAVNTSEVPAPCTQLTAIGQADGVNLQWDLPTYFPSGSTFKVLQYTSATPIGSATQIYEGKATSFVVPITDAANPTLYYWVVPSFRGNDAPPCPADAGIGAKALSVTAGFRATASPGSQNKTGSAASQTTNTVTVTAAGGTPAYSYAWTRLSGDASTTCNSASAAATTFTRASMSNFTAYNSIWRCTVTDTLLATATVDVPINFYREPAT